MNLKGSLNIGLDTDDEKISDLESRSEKITLNEALYLKEESTNPPL